MERTSVVSYSSQREELVSFHSQHQGGLPAKSDPSRLTPLEELRLTLVSPRALTVAAAVVTLRAASTVMRGASWALLASAVGRALIDRKRGQSWALSAAKVWRPQALRSTSGPSTP